MGLIGTVGGIGEEKLIKEVSAVLEAQAIGRTAILMYSASTACSKDEEVQCLYVYGEVIEWGHLCNIIKECYPSLETLMVNCCEIAEGSRSIIKLIEEVIPTTLIVMIDNGLSNNIDETMFIMNQWSAIRLNMLPATANGRHIYYQYSLPEEYYVKLATAGLTGGVNVWIDHFGVESLEIPSELNISELLVE